MKVGLRKLLTAIPLVVILMLALTGVARQIEEVYEPTPTPIPTPVATPRPTPTPVPTPTPIPSSPEGVAVSRLTGLYICEEAARRRPFAVVYNNESRGLPQMGLMQADIIYEVLAEGSITRVIAIFQDFDAEMIGPIRSARHYFTNFALDSGAVFVHHGASTQGYNAIRNLGLDNIDGMRFDGTVFWRDADRRRERGLEHSSFTSAERLMNVAEQLNLDMVAPDYLGMFEFFEEPTAPRPENIANTINIHFWGQHVSVFEYNPEDNLYYKYIFGGPQMDAGIDQQVAVTNVIVQITNIAHIPGDAAGRRNVDLVGSGYGYLVTRGTYSRIQWVKDSPNEPTRWYDENGQPLRLNPGRTWISVTHNQPTFDDGEDDDIEQ